MATTRLEMIEEIIKKEEERMQEAGIPVPTPPSA